MHHVNRWLRHNEEWPGEAFHRVGRTQNLSLGDWSEGTCQSRHRASAHWPTGRMRFSGTVTTGLPLRVQVRTGWSSMASAAVYRALLLQNYGKLNACLQDNNSWDACSVRHQKAVGNSKRLPSPYVGRCALGVILMSDESAIPDHFTPVC